jgi:hypothetical protein
LLQDSFEKRKADFNAINPSQDPMINNLDKPDDSQELRACTVVSMDFETMENPGAKYDLYFPSLSEDFFPRIQSSSKDCTIPTTFFSLNSAQPHFFLLTQLPEQP